MLNAMGAISDFIRHHYRHFNGAALVDAADAYIEHVNAGGQMLVTLAGAMSTAELGLSLAEMIRQGKVHAICCTGANLEEDVFNLVAHDHYVRIPNYRFLTPEQEEELLDQHLNRVTDTCIPEFEAIRRIEGAVLDEWQGADKAGHRYFPHEFMYKILRSGVLEHRHHADREIARDAAADLEKPDRAFAAGGLIPVGEHHHVLDAAAHGMHVGDVVGNAVGGVDVAERRVLPTRHEHR